MQVKEDTIASSNLAQLNLAIDCLPTLMRMEQDTLSQAIAVGSDLTFDLHVSSRNGEHDLLLRLELGSPQEFLVLCFA